jgi:plasmid maintenance system antidote protein VapI
MKELLERMGWSQNHFAKHLGVSPRSVYNWVHVKENPVAMKYLEFCVRTLGV